MSMLALCRIDGYSSDANTNVVQVKKMTLRMVLNPNNVKIENSKAIKIHPLANCPSLLGTVPESK